MLLNSYVERNAVEVYCFDLSMSKGGYKHNDYCDHDLEWL